MKTITIDELVWKSRYYQMRFITVFIHSVYNKCRYHISCTNSHLLNIKNPSMNYVYAFALGDFYKKIYMFFDGDILEGDFHIIETYMKEYENCQFFFGNGFIEDTSIFAQIKKKEITPYEAYCVMEMSVV